MKYLTCIIFSVVTFCSIAQSDPEIYGVDINGRIPEGLAYKVVAPPILGILDGKIKYQSKYDVREGPLVVYFIMGAWCEDCQKTLSHLKDSLNLIEEIGAKLLVIAPDPQEKIDGLKKKLELDYRILHDAGMKNMKTYDVLFNVNERFEKELAKEIGIDLNAYNQSNSALLPVPAVYIIHSNGYVVWKYFDFNFENQVTVKEILNNIPRTAEK